MKSAASAVPERVSAQSTVTVPWLPPVRLTKKVKVVVPELPSACDRSVTESSPAGPAKPKSTVRLVLGSLSPSLVGSPPAVRVKRGVPVTVGP